MKTRLISVAAALILFASGAWANEIKSRYFLGIGEPTSESWQVIVNNFTDR